MTLILSHPTGNQFVRAATKGLVKKGRLWRFYTTLAVLPDSFLEKLSRQKAFSVLKRRSYDKELGTLTNTYPWLEMGRLLSAKMKWNRFITPEKGLFSVEAVYENLDRRVASTLPAARESGVSAVYAYEDGAYHTFKRAKMLGIGCHYDLPIGYWKAARDMLGSERERWPEWVQTIQGFQDSEEKLNKKDQELLLADHIYVASSFTAETVRDYFPSILCPIEIIPYGFPPVFETRVYPTQEGRRLKLLFVGGLSQRKGIADLFAAVRSLEKNIELTVVGRKPNVDCQALDNELARHTWIPTLSHAEVLEQMRNSDVLVFPSLFEGFGMVITEAMSQGTPVITTDRTAGPDFIEHGRNGWLVPAGNPEALRTQIEELLDWPNAIEKNGRAALVTARKRPWSTYGEELATRIEQGLRESLLANEGI